MRDVAHAAMPYQSGDVLVSAPARIELLTTNAVDEQTNATRAASDGELFQRTDKSPSCIGNR